MKTNYTDFAKRYRLAYAQVWGALTHWKKVAIESDKLAGRETRLNDELAKAVIEMAEDESIKLVDPAPVGKSVKKKNPVIAEPASNN